MVRNARYALELNFDTPIGKNLMTRQGLLSTAFQSLRYSMLILLLGIFSAKAIPVTAVAPSAAWTDAERWAWTKLTQGEVADFNERCGKEKSELGTLGVCRKLSARFLVAALTSPPWSEQIPLNLGMRIVGARIVGDIDLENTRITRDLSLVESLIEGKASFRRAQVQSFISFTGTTIMDEFDATGVYIARSFNLRGSKFDNDVSFDYAKIDGFINLDSALIRGAFKAVSLQIGNSILMESATLEKRSNLRFANIGQDIDIRGAQIRTGLDLSSARIMRNLLLNGKTQWGSSGGLYLINAHVNNLVASCAGWPQSGDLRMRGFVFTSLGVSEFEGLSCGAQWWDHWARLDPEYSPQIYAQLASIFSSHGDRREAEEIRYLGRMRQQETLSGLSFIWSLISQYFAGFGIGTYASRAVIAWVAAISFFGAVILWERVERKKDYGQDFMWCWGASLSRLLPIIKLNIEFDEYFAHKDHRERLKGWPSFFFACVAVLGWALGVILLGAVSGLTGKS